MDTVEFAHEGKIWVPTERFDLLLYIYIYIIVILMDI